MKLPFELQIRWSNNLKWVRRKQGGEWYLVRDYTNPEFTTRWTREKPWHMKHTEVLEQEVYY